MKWTNVYDIMLMIKERRKREREKKMDREHNRISNLKMCPSAYNLMVDQVYSILEYTKQVWEET